METIPSDEKRDVFNTNIHLRKYPESTRTYFWDVSTYEKRWTESHFSLMKSFRYFINSFSVTIESTSMLNLLSADHVSMATSTIRVLSCSLKIWGIKSITFNVSDSYRYKLKVQRQKWLIDIKTDFIFINIPAVCCYSQSVRSVWSCHQTAAHYRQLDAVNTGHSLKDRQIIMFALIRWESIGVLGPDKH